MTPPNPANRNRHDWGEYDDEMEKPRITTDIEDTVDAKGKLLNQQPTYDRLLYSEVQMQIGDEVATEKVARRAEDPDGQIRGEYDHNPTLNSYLCEVEFTDGSVREYSANMIAENILTQVDEEGYSPTMMNAIIDHEVDWDVAVAKEEGTVYTNRDSKWLRKATAGWKCLVQ